MAKVSFFTVGCKLNQYETELIAQKLCDLGLERVDWAESADLYIINGCSVTKKAAADSRRKIFAARRTSPNAVVIMTGCYAQIQRELLEKMPEIDLVVLNEDKDQIIAKISQIFPDINADLITDTNPALKSFYHHSRALIKIQDGCNQNCSYCVVPLGRGRERSRSVEEILEEIRAVRDNGYKEIILTGVHIGRYKYDQLKLGDLIRFILDETEIPRIRLSSIELNEIDDNLLRLASEYVRICPHFHIPLQSGSDRILKNMNRPYVTEDYLAVTKALKANVKNVMLGADIIVGFPGEDESRFNETIDFIENSPIDYLHVFSYSDHPEAKSHAFPDKIEGKIIKKRNELLTKLGNLKWQKFLNSQMSKDHRVLFERRHSKESGKLTGLSDNYIRIECPGSDQYFNTIQKVKPVGIEGTKMLGTIIS
jgi:threonylcarbamoyladenosine tRNA methylthiotransferase MtaB